MFFQPLFRFFFCFHVRKQTKYKSLSFTHAAFPRNGPACSLEGVTHEFMNYEFKFLGNLHWQFPTSRPSNITGNTPGRL